jgi:hypothetical protein
MKGRWSPFWQQVSLLANCYCTLDGTDSGSEVATVWQHNLKKKSRQEEQFQLQVKDVERHE